MFFGGWQRDGFLDRKGKAERLLFLVSEGEEVDGWRSRMRGGDVWQREIRGGAGDSWLAGSDNRLGLFGLL